MADYNMPSKYEEEESWEDLPATGSRRDSLDASESSVTPSQSASYLGSNTHRRRKVFVATQPKPYSRGAKPGSVRNGGSSQRAHRPGATSDISDGLRGGGIESARYAAGVFKISMRFLKHPLALLLFLYIFAWIVQLLSNTLRSALAPICTIPVFTLLCPASFKDGSAIGNHERGPPKHADFPRLVDIQHKTLERLLEETVDGTGLSLEVKKAEMATADLATLVRISDLASRDRLASMLGDFVVDARETGRHLQRFSAQVTGAVDTIMAINDYAMHTIESAKSNKNSITKMVMALVPFAPPVDEYQTVTQSFTIAMDTLASNMDKLQLENAAVMARLDRLEMRLASIHELVAAEDGSLSAAREELLAMLWTKLGGNQRTLRGMDKHASLLSGVGHYRNRALAHVVATMQALSAYAEDMEVLRERVAAPALTADSIPVEAHVRSISAGLKRLQERLDRAERRKQEITDAILNGVVERTLSAH